MKKPTQIVTSHITSEAGFWNILVILAESGFFLLEMKVKVKSIGS